jgi:hypothetical protein
MLAGGAATVDEGASVVGASVDGVSVVGGGGTGVVVSGGAGSVVCGG